MTCGASCSHGWNGHWHPILWNTCTNLALLQHLDTFVFPCELVYVDYLFAVSGSLSKKCTSARFRALCGAVCIINSYNTLLNRPIVSLLILFILFSMFFVLIHDYTLYFIGSPCCNFSYHNYISLWPYYIVIHSKVYKHSILRYYHTWQLSCGFLIVSLLS